MTNSVRKIVTDIWENLKVSDTSPLDMDRLVAAVERCAEALEQLVEGADPAETFPQVGQAEINSISLAEGRRMERELVLACIGRVYSPETANIVAGRLPPIPNEAYRGPGLAPTPPIRMEQPYTVTMVDAHGNEVPVPRPAPPTGTVEAVQTLVQAQYNRLNPPGFIERVRNYRNTHMGTLQEAVAAIRAVDVERARLAEVALATPTNIWTAPTAVPDDASAAGTAVLGYWREVTQERPPTHHPPEDGPEEDFEPEE